MVKQSSLRRKRSSKRKTSVRRKRSSKRNTSTRRRRSSKRKTSVRRRRSSKRKTSRRRRRSSKKKKSARRKQRGGAQAAAPPPPPVGVHAIEINNLIQAIDRRPKNYISYIHKQTQTTPIAYIGTTYTACGNKHSACGYDMDIFKIITDAQIQNIVPKVDGIYSKLHVSDGAGFDINSERNILKYILPNNANIISFGDFHSDIHSLQIALLDLQEMGVFNSEWVLTDTYYLVLMGDLVDRGPYGVEIMYLIYNLFIINNTEEYKVIILNGNHEEQNTYGTARGQSDYGFGKEMTKQLPGSKIILEDLMKKLPLGLFIKSIDAPLWYQFCHGGISAAHEGNEIKDFLDPANKNNIYMIGTLQDAQGFMWSDFSHTERLARGGKKSGRGGPGSFTYFRNGIDGINKHNKIKTIISGHQDNIHFGVVLNQRFPDGRPVTEDVDNNKYSWPESGWYYPNGKEISLMGVSDIPWDQVPSIADVVGNTTINMDHVSATIMSGAALPKLTPVSIYSILHLFDNTSTIRWLPTCNISSLVNLPPSMYNVPDAGNCPAWNSTWQALQAAEAGGGGGGGAAPPPPPPAP